MKRTISLEAGAAANYLRNSGITPAHQLQHHAVAAPWDVLGVGPEAEWPQVRQAFISRLRQFPPERCPQEFVLVVDAYDVLKRHFRNVGVAVGGGTSSSTTCSDGGCSTTNPTVKRRRACEAGGVLPGVPQTVTASTCAGDFAPAPRGVIALDMTGVAHHPGVPSTAAFGGGGASGGMPHVGFGSMLAPSGFCAPAPLAGCCGAPGFATGSGLPSSGAPRCADDAGSAPMCIG